MKISYLALAIGLVISSASFAADDWTKNLHPYVGADYQYMHYQYQTFSGVNGNSVLPQGLNGGDIHIGIRPFTYAGAELGYFMTDEPTKHVTSTISSKVRTQGATLDLLGYLPLGNNIEAIGTGGVLWNKAELTVPGAGKDSKSEIDGRIGAGLQLNVLPNINVRGLVRYQTADFSSTADHAIVYNIGVNYNF